MGQVSRQDNQQKLPGTILLKPEAFMYWKIIKSKNVKRINFFINFLRSNLEYKLNEYEEKNFV